MTHPPKVKERVPILLVDDRPGNLTALKAMLEDPDYDLTLASSGVEALDAVLHQDFAVILLDVAMPEMDGFETATLIKQRERSCRIPILFITASIYDVEHIYKGYSVGAVDYLQKPIAPEVVRAKVAVFVELYLQKVRIQRQEEELREVERKRSAAALRESQAQYEGTFDQAPVGIAHVSVDGRLLRMNEQFCKISGRSRQELLGLSFEDLTHSEDLPGILEARENLRRGAVETYAQEQRCVHKDGWVLWVKLTMSLLRDSEGAPKNFIAVVEDITGKKRTEQSQRFLAQASEILLGARECEAALAEVTRLAVPGFADWCVVDLPSARDDWWEHPIVAHQDRDRAAQLGEVRARMSLDPDIGIGLALRTQQPLLVPNAQEWLASGQIPSDRPPSVEALGVTTFLMVPMCARGRTLGALSFFAAEGRRRYDAADLEMAADLAHRMAFAVDNAHLYQQAQEAIAARDEFLFIASHELRTPLTPLLIQLQRLLRGSEQETGVTPEAARTMLRRAERQVKRLVTLIESLLDVSRISSGRLELQVEPVDLVDVLRDVTGRFREELLRTSSALELRNDGPVEGRWDRLRIEQVVTNLVSNAIKYGGGKPILVSARADGDRAWLMVQDHGIGIEKEKLSRIFDRFERAVPSHSYGGLGLGLYIARQIVNAHGGTIHVTSEPGSGSTFTVEIPKDVPGAGEHQDAGANGDAAHPPA
jgi:PAS domain S-box-containing protein